MSMLPSKCLQITTKFLNNPLALDFKEKLELPREYQEEYNRIVKRPMWISRIKTKLQEGKYQDVSQWVADFKLVFDNAMAYNPEDSLIHGLAKYMKSKFLKLYKEMTPKQPDDYIGKVKKLYSQYLKVLANPPPSITVNASKLNEKPKEGVPIVINEEFLTNLTSELNKIPQPNDVLEGMFTGTDRCIDIGELDEETIKKLVRKVLKK